MEKTAKEWEAAWREFYAGPDKLTMMRWSELARRLDKIIESLLDQSNPYFSDE